MAALPGRGPASAGTPLQNLFLYADKRIEEQYSRFFILNSKDSMKKIVINYTAILFLLLGAGNATAFEVRLAGDRLSVQADQVPLQAILSRLAGLGIRVFIDPELNPEISASFEDRDVQKALASILKPYNHVLVWESIEGSPGPIMRLAEIQVFSPGRKELLKEKNSKGNLAVAVNPTDGSRYVKGELLLRLHPEMRLSEFKKLLLKIGGTVVDSHPSLGVYRIRLPEESDAPAVAGQIRSYPGVESSEPNYAYPVNVPQRSEISSIPQVNPSHADPEEHPAPVAILDTGLMPNAGLENKILASLNAVNPDQPIYDSLGHGTQMALIASGMVRPLGAGETESQNPIIAVRAFDENGYTSSFNIMESIDFAVKKGARVMSLSWGSEISSEFLEDALASAVSAGLIIVASAGNEPTGRPVYPAAYSSVIAVGALGPDGKTWENSNYGDFVMLYAPGFASLPMGYKGDPGTYAGTSIATAYVANLIAGYLSRNPEGNILQVFQFLGGSVVNAQ
jgi:hypothetical protein